jgi:hypothetical protein
MNGSRSPFPPGSPFEDFFNFPFEERNPPERKIQSGGSGFIISSDGYVLTNHHVIEDASEITISLNDRREFRAKLIGSDKKADVAVLKINSEKDLNRYRLFFRKQISIITPSLSGIASDLFSNGTKQLIDFLSQSDRKVIAGGGETIFAINKFSEKKNFHYVSTAGGAFLEYLSGKSLPSVEALELE